jgi:hypothetical protein
MLRNRERKQGRRSLLLCHILGRFPSVAGIDLHWVIDDIDIWFDLQERGIVKVNTLVYQDA